MGEVWIAETKEGATRHRACQVARAVRDTCCGNASWQPGPSNVCPWTGPKDTCPTAPAPTRLRASRDPFRPSLCVYPYVDLGGWPPVHWRRGHGNVSHHGQCSADREWGEPPSTRSSAPAATRPCNSIHGHAVMQLVPTSGSAPRPHRPRRSLLVLHRSVPLAAILTALA
jgi:hypothetical protein